MSSTGISAYRFKVPTRCDLVLAGHAVSQREGILLERDGWWAEASPLPGFSRESIAEVVSALRGETSDKPVPAALRFGLSSLSMPTPSHLRVPLNKLLMGEEDHVLADAKSCDQMGFKAAKLKVGRTDPTSEIRLVHQVRNHLPDHVQLRLDANQAWTFEEAENFAKGVEGLDIEYLEEPLQDPLQLEDFYSQTGIRYALDETLAGETSLDSWPNAAALICKPTILGGREDIERLAAADKPVVFSSAFESGVGVTRIMQLAAEFSPNIPAGLDTLAWMEDDLLFHSPRTQDGVMILDEFAVNEESLEPLLP